MWNLQPGQYTVQLFIETEKKRLRFNYDLITVFTLNIWTP